MLRDQPCPQSPMPQKAVLPRIWLFTDERNDAQLDDAIIRLPRHSGIIFRHYHLPENVRRVRFDEVKHLARRHGHLVFLAGSAALAKRWRADGVHGNAQRRAAKRGLLHSVPVHDAKEIHRANRAGADLFFLSPIFATHSHPGQHPLSPLQVKRLATLCDGKVIFLGGMDRKRYQRRKNALAYGWAAISALS